jgi:hypothetical protein
MLSDQFSQIFRDEHREIRDTLLDLIVAFQERDKARIQTLLQQTAIISQKARRTRGQGTTQ